jgi:glycosyltransferase involved in cell wall biosynthesis
MQISVVICTFNPRQDYFHRVLAALKAQTLPKENWELLLVDNASEKQLAEVWDLSWHPKARHIREEVLGLTPARLRSIAESQGEIVVFVDDDNVLAADYLEKAIEVAAKWPMVGAWCGNLCGEFEVVPPKHLIPQLNSLAVRQLDRDYWSNIYGFGPAMPCGAGMCVRRDIAEEYAQRCRNNVGGLRLDRTGDNFVSAGDNDIAYCAIDLGYGMARFRALALTHLIPAVRTTDDYIIKLEAGMAYSAVLLASLRRETHLPAPRSFVWHWLKRSLNWVGCKNNFQRRLVFATGLATDRAWRDLSRAETNSD